MSHTSTMMEDHHEHEQLRRSAPTLFGLPKHDPFIIPDGFFERFPHEVQAIVAKPAAMPFNDWLKCAAIAFPVLALIAFGIHALRDTAHETVALDLSPDEAAFYSAPDLSDTHEILGEAAGMEWPVFDTVTVQLSADEALAYVDRENIDLTEMIANP